MLEFLFKYPNKIIEPFLEHIAITVQVMAISLALAFLIALLFSSGKLFSRLAVGFFGGMKNVDAYLLEAASGMGLGRMQVFFRVQLPLALPSILAGIRLAAVSTVGIAVVGASINAGGLGVLLFDGMRTGNTVKIVWGVILAALLNLMLHWILYRLERLVKKRLRL